MTKEQFQEIKNRAWKLCVRDNKEWAVNTKEKECNRYIPVSLTLKSKLDGNEYRILSYKYANFEKDYSLLIYKYFDSDPIDSLCDMMITAMNAGASFNDEECAKMLEQDYPTHSDITFLLEEKYNVEAFNVFTHFEISRLVFSLIKEGYDPYLCLLEKLKEIETRTGSWNEREGKWCKDLGAYTIEGALKKAEDEEECGFDLSLCLLKEDNDFWLIGDDDEEFAEEQSLDEIKYEFVGHCVKIKKWYKADYAKCKLQGVEQ